jgi:hypothetical protein
MLKRIAAIVALVLLCGAAGFLGGILAYLQTPVEPPPPIPGTIRAQRFEVTDNGGRVVAELTGSALNLKDAYGRVRATLRLINNDQGILGFSDGRWEGRAVFGFLSSDAPSGQDDDWGLVIYSPDNRSPVVALGTGGKGRYGSLSLWSKEGTRTISAP